MTKDLTVGSPIKLIISFSVPLLFGYLFQQFYNVVDTIIVGQFLGKEALAAVGSTGPVNFLIIGFCMGVCNGFAIPIAYKFGAKDYSVMRQFVANSAYLSVIIAFVLTVLTVGFCKQLLTLMLTPANIIDYAADYIRIIFAGIPAVFLYNLLAGYLRSVGDSKTPLYFLILSSVLNIILDLLFIVVIKLGVQGAALATVLSQMISGLACLLFIKKKFQILHLSKDDKKIRTHHFVTLCSSGIPMGAQYSITAIGSVILQTSVNTLGSDIVAAVTAVNRISMFFCCPFDAMGTTMATWGGQNTGAVKFTRLKKGLFDCNILGLIYSVIAFGVMFFFGDTLGLLFLDSSESAILDKVHYFLIILSAFYYPLAIVNIFRFLIQGMGFGKLAILAGVFELIGRVIIGTIFVPRYGFTAACFAAPLAWILADAFLIPAFFVCYNKIEWNELMFRGGFDEKRAEKY